MNPSGVDATRLRWDPEAVRRLDEDIEWAITSNPTGSAEIAGILLGKIGPTLEITDCKPVFLMQPRDHAYALAGPGKEHFKSTIAGFRSISDDRYSVIGFYRTDIGGKDLTDEDLGLVRTCFPETSPVVLLIQRTVNGSVRIKLFLGDRGEALRHVHSLESEPISHAAPALPRWLELWHGLSGDGAAAITEAENAPLVPPTKSPKTTTAPSHSIADSRPVLRVGESQAAPGPLKRGSKRSPVFLLAGLSVGYSHGLPNPEGVGESSTGGPQRRSRGPQSSARHLSHGGIGVTGREAQRCSAALLGSYRTCSGRSDWGTADHPRRKWTRETGYA